MRLLRGSRSGGAFGGRSDYRVGVALALTFSVANACGGRTLEYDGADSGGEGNVGGVSGSGVGGGKPGSGGQGGTNPGSGGTVTAGVTGGGVGGSQPITGGGPTTGGTGGSTTGGVAGSVAGSAPAAGGVTMTGGRGGSGATPGRGSGGRGGSPGRGVGGSAGAPGQGGTGVGAMGGAGGQAGAGGSPAVDDACKRACSNMPPACEPAPVSDCLESCLDASTEAPSCQLEFVDYVGCVADSLNPTAVCMVTDVGDCVGPGCTTTAIDNCGGLLEAFGSCTAGCSSGYGVGSDGCTYTRDCQTHAYSTRCTPDGSGGWFCVCSVDGVDRGKGELYGDASQVCVDAEIFCQYTY